MIQLRCIISGGQTGSDRGGLLAAYDLGLRRGGMAPLGWRAEDGTIPQFFRFGMTESASEAYRVRTHANVQASGGTLILSFGSLPHDSGSMLTGKIARREGKPVRHLTLPLGRIGGDLMLEWMVEHKIVTLNVAGPRESREPGIQAATHAALVCILGDDLGFGGR